MNLLEIVALWAFCACQIAYALTFVIDLYFFTRPVNWVEPELARPKDPQTYPYIVLFYPVLRELEGTMRTTFTALRRLDYPRDRYEIVAIPNADDIETIASLRLLQKEFDFLRIILVPKTSHRSWRVVWDNWERTKKAYWWHEGRRAHNRNLPPKKTRQLIYAFYTVAQKRGKNEFLVNYIDADSCPPADHFLAAAAGIELYDVLQAQNIAGNLNASLAASWHAFDHMAWDGAKYPHLSANGTHPFWVLGKGLFFRASDLLALGGFHPWLTIEDPEVGMRFWVNGKKLGIISNPLIEEVPYTFAHGITQRKRWVAGFFQSLTTPLSQMGMRPWDRFKAWLNFLPCLSLWLNSIGLPLGIWAIAANLDGQSPLPQWVIVLAALNFLAFIASTTALYVRTWHRTGLVLDRWRDRAWYLLRVNPIALMIWWLMWLIPLWIGFRMFLKDEGLAWERTEKIDANHALVRTTSTSTKQIQSAVQPIPASDSGPLSVLSVAQPVKGSSSNA